MKKESRTPTVMIKYVPSADEQSARVALWRLLGKKYHEERRDRTPKKVAHEYAITQPFTVTVVARNL